MFGLLALGRVYITDPGDLINGAFLEALSSSFPHQRDEGAHQPTMYVIGSEITGPVYLKESDLTFYFGVEGPPLIDHL